MKCCRQFLGVDRPSAAEAAHHRDDRRHAVLHGRDGTSLVRRRRARADPTARSRWSNRLRLCVFRRPCKPSSPPASTGCAPMRKTSCKRLPCLDANSTSASRRAVAGRSEDELERLIANLQLGEFVYEQPSISDIEYIFKHALTQEVAYNSILLERRKQLHEDVARAIEGLYPASLDDHLRRLGAPLLAQRQSGKGRRISEARRHAGHGAGSAAPSRAESAKARSRCSEHFPRARLEISWNCRF